MGRLLNAWSWLALHSVLEGARKDDQRTIVHHSHLTHHRKVKNSVITGRPGRWSGAGCRARQFSRPGWSSCFLVLPTSRSNKRMWNIEIKWTYIWWSHSLGKGITSFSHNKPNTLILFETVDQWILWRNYFIPQKRKRKKKKRGMHSWDVEQRWQAVGWRTSPFSASTSRSKQKLR